MKKILIDFCMGLFVILIFLMFCTYVWFLLFTTLGHIFVAIATIIIIGAMVNYD